MKTLRAIAWLSLWVAVILLLLIGSAWIAARYRFGGWWLAAAVVVGFVTYQIRQTSRTKP